MPPGQRQEASGTFALSRTHADLSRASSKPRVSTAVRYGLTGAAVALLFGTVASFGLLRRPPVEMPSSTAVAAAAFAMPAPEPIAAPISTSIATESPAPEAATPVPSPSASAEHAPVRAKPMARPAASTARPSFLKSRK